jgi:hypothetical protein
MSYLARMNGEVTHPMAVSLESDPATLRKWRFNKFTEVHHELYQCRLVR